MEREKEGTWKEVGKRRRKEGKEEDEEGKRREVERDRNGDREWSLTDRTLILSMGTSLCCVLLLKTGNPCLGGHPGDLRGTGRNS